MDKPLKPAANTPLSIQGWTVKDRDLAERNTRATTQTILTIWHLDTPPTP